MPLALLDKVKTNQKEFGEKVADMAAKLGVPADWLMFPMYFESGLNAKAVNKITGASGLIQFMPSTAKALGTTVEAIRNMSNLQQLPFVYKYFLQYKNKIKAPVDAYLAVFFPAAIGKGNDFVIEAKNLRDETVAKANKIFDLNSDGKITVGEIVQTLSTKVPDALKKFFAAPATKIGLGALLIGAGLLYFLLKK